jgi:hypothetical protein
MVIFTINLLILFILIIHNISTKQKDSINLCNIKNIIKILVRQCSRWAVAAIQDKSPIIALLHSNYACGYLWALKDIANDNQIKKATNIDILVFTKKITNIQDMCTKKVSNNCPQFLEHIDKELAKLGGDM